MFLTSHYTPNRRDSQANGACLLALKRLGESLNALSSRQNLPNKHPQRPHSAEVNIKTTALASAVAGRPLQRPNTFTPLEPSR